MPHEPFYLEVGPFAVVPVCHYRAEYAHELRRVFLAYKPTRVALELPHFLGQTFQKAVGRFPKLSVIAYDVGDRKMLLPVEPTDAFAEAARSAAAEQMPVHYIDLDMREYQPPDLNVPDTAALAAIGAQAFYEQWVAEVGPSRHPQDREREQHMIQRLRQLAHVYPDARWLVVCGLAHANAIVEGLGASSWENRNFTEERPPALIEIYQPDVDSIRQMSQELPLMMALYELERGGEGSDPNVWTNPEPEEPAAPRMPTALEQMSTTDLVGSLESLLGMGRGKKKPPPGVRPDQLKAVNDYLNRLADQPMAFADLLGQLMGDKKDEFKLPQLPAPAFARAFVFKQVPDRRAELRTIYSTMTAQALHEQWDRQRVLLQLCDRAAQFYHENTGEQIKPWQLDVLYKFTGNYAHLKSRLLPGLFELVMGARGVADDNYSYEVWDLATFYPWTDPEEGVQSIKMGPDELFLGDLKVQHWTFHRKIPRFRQRVQRIPVQKREHEDTPGEWSEEFNRGTLCSYPPEDIVIEDYGRYLQKKAVSILSSEKSRVEPFTTSLLDGIDMRETLRNWHDKKIFVRETQRVNGGVGSVIIIYDEDPGDDKFPWKMAWHGEHQQESDMAFYATPLQAKVVGPGIARCEYGGLMLTYPPGRLADVWRDPFYRSAQTKAELLLMAGLDYSEEKHVVYVAAKQPRSVFRQLAARVGKKIVYVPIGQLSPQSLKRIRVFHVLSGHKLREIAKNYIW